MALPTAFYYGLISHPKIEAGDGNLALIRVYVTVCWGIEGPLASAVANSILPLPSGCGWNSTIRLGTERVLAMMAKQSTWL